MKTIKFAGYDWEIKISDDLTGPGPNFYSEECVSVQNNELILEVIEKDKKLLCGEVILTESLGYGKYVFFLSSRIDLLLDNIVFGLFTWSNSALPNNCEIDIEFSRWDNETITNSQYVVQPSKTSDKLFRYDTHLTGDYSTHIIDWKPNEINFWSIHGHFLTPPSKNHIIELWTYKGNAVPKPNNEHIHINLWKYGRHSLREEKDKLKSAKIKDFMFFPYLHI
ncbi:family 16 glycosylhydrolase [Flavobacterium sp. UBA6031]|uniref:family 16 glycosylhydrolase n=1 Tax=Flavobacterium sp. UBA6031 TaxID=1946551 RepID=UPI0025B94AA8|nr:family 16 glycosylhydrolase [Flavobacterium sp. UBA6031]